MSTSVMVRFALVLPLSVAVLPLSAGAQETLPTVTATATDASAAEGNAGDTGTVALTRTGPTSSPLDVNYTTIPSTADRGKDYKHPGVGTPAGGTGITHTVTIPAGAAGNTAGIGARVAVYRVGGLGRPEDLLGTATIETGNGFSSASPAAAHFGLGDVSAVDVEVTLPAGRGLVTRTGVAADQSVRVS